VRSLEVDALLKDARERALDITAEPSSVPSRSSPRLRRGGRS
jgi:hypothetical protein